MKLNVKEKLQLCWTCNGPLNEVNETEFWCDHCRMVVRKKEDVK